jgi:hypothetical protein
MLGMLRLAAAALGLMLIGVGLWIVESTQRPLVYSADEMTIGAALLVAAFAIHRDTTRRRALLAAAWSAAAGLLYGVFFESFAGTRTALAEQIPAQTYTILVGSAMTFSFLGLFITVTLPRHSTLNRDGD